MASRHNVGNRSGAQQQEPDNEHEARNGVLERPVVDAEY